MRRLLSRGLTVATALVLVGCGGGDGPTGGDGDGNGGGAAATSISVVSGDNQRGVQGSGLLAGFVVKVGDAQGNGVSGVTVAWSVTAAITGVGMALLYPTLIAAIGDISHPNWRGSSLGVYRFWRDTGYGIGALLIGLIADLTMSIEAGFWFVSAAMAVSGLWVAVFAEETHPRLYSKD